jgi:hypothetical protein
MMNLIDGTNIEKGDLVFINGSDLITEVLKELQPYQAGIH